MFKCSGCKLIKEATDFYPSNASRTRKVNYYCKQCCHLHAVARRPKYKERLIAQQAIWREANREQIRTKGKLKRSNLKQEVLAHYSKTDPPECVCCDETHPFFLTIDHINGGGCQQRKQLKLNGSSFYAWLKRNNYPEGFQVLCMNCNFAFGKFGYCPHLLNNMRTIWQAA